MGTVYILRSLINNRYYVGSTIDLESRLKQHNRGKTKSLKFSKPYEISFSQEYNSITDARKIEFKLKKLKSRAILDRIIKEGKINLGP